MEEETSLDAREAEPLHCAWMYKFGWRRKMAPRVLLPGPRLNVGLHPPARYWSAILDGAHHLPEQRALREVGERHLSLTPGPHNSDDGDDTEAVTS